MAGLRLFSCGLSWTCHGTTGLGLIIFSFIFPWWFGLINILEAEIKESILEHIQPREAFGACPLGKLRGEESTEKVPFALSKHHRTPVSPKGAVESKKGNSSLWTCTLVYSTRANKIIFWTQQEFIDGITECSRIQISERDCLGLNQSSPTYWSCDLGQIL